MQSTTQWVFVWFPFCNNSDFPPQGEAYKENLTAFRQTACSLRRHLSHLCVNLVTSTPAADSARIRGANPGHPQKKGCSSGSHSRHDVNCEISLKG